MTNEEYLNLIDKGVDQLKQGKLTPSEYTEYVLSLKKELNKYTPEELNLIILWLDGTLGATEFAKQAKLKNVGSVYNFIALGLREMYTNGNLVLRKVKK